MIDAPPPIPEAFHNRLWEALKTYYFTGGMPEVVQTYLNHQPVSHETFLRVREIQTLLIQGYRADFAKHSGKTNAALFDVGLPGCMADIPIQTILSQDFGSYKGFIAENYVAQELQSGGFTELYSWKGKTSEIEFLVVINGKIIPLEVKSGLLLVRRAALVGCRRCQTDRMQPDLLR